MRRRDFIALCAGLGISSLAHAQAQAQAQAQQARLHRVGVLLLGIADAESFKAELREGLRTSGYKEGQNIAFEFRSAEGKEALLPKLAAELVALKVDVIVALFTPCAIAAKEARAKFPLSSCRVTRSGQVLLLAWQALAGNVSGVSLMAVELHGKCVELLRDMLPNTRRVAGLFNAEDPSWKAIEEQVILAGKATGVEIHPSILVHSASENCDSIRENARRGSRGVGRPRQSSHQAGGGLGAQARPAGSHCSQGICGGGRPHDLWGSRSRHLSAQRAVCYKKFFKAPARQACPSNSLRSSSSSSI
jgi:ABC-type uncharacterized transport system substrate-binding protein